MKPCILILLFAQAAGQVALSGRITDSVTHQPVEGALIQYQSADATSDANGAWSLNAKPFVSNRELIISKKGYAGIRQYFTLKSGAAESHDFELDPAAHLSGRVVDRDSGKPVPGMMATLRGSRGSFLADASADDGSFVIKEDLPPGSYILDFHPQSGAKLVLEKAKTAPPGYGHTWFPAAPRADMAAPIMLLAGENREIEMKLEKRERRHISAVVQVPEGREAEPVSISLTTSGRGTLLGGRMPKAGPLRIEGLDDGTYELEADFPLTSVVFDAAERRFRRTNALEPAFAIATVEINDHDVEDLKLTMRPGVSIRGVVSVAEQGGKVPAGIGFYLSGMPASPARSQAIARAGMLHESLRLEGFPSGEYWANLILPTGYVLASMSYNGRSVLDASIDVEAPDSVIDFVLTTRPASVRGTVRDSNGNTVPEAIVLLLPDPAPAQLNPVSRTRLTTKTDANGAFHIGDLAPGKYRALVNGESAETVELDFAQTATLDLHVK